jgi:hypothetical protein
VPNRSVLDIIEEGSARRNSIKALAIRAKNSGLAVQSNLGSTVRLRFTVEGDIRRDALKPDFPPKRVDAPRAEHATVTIPGLANDGIQHNARVLELLHLSRFLINDFADSLEYTVCSTAIGDHLGVEEKAAILIFSIQSREDFYKRFYADKFTRLQAEGCRGCGLPDGYVP